MRSFLLCVALRHYVVLSFVYSFYYLHVEWCAHADAIFTHQILFIQNCVCLCDYDSNCFMHNNPSALHRLQVYARTLLTTDCYFVYLVFVTEKPKQFETCKEFMSHPLQKCLHIFQFFVCRELWLFGSHTGRVHTLLCECNKFVMKIYFSSLFSNYIERLDNHNNLYGKLLLVIKWNCLSPFMVLLTAEWTCAVRFAGVQIMKMPHIFRVPWAVRVSMKLTDSNDNK